MAKKKYHPWKYLPCTKECCCKCPKEDRMACILSDRKMPWQACPECQIRTAKFRGLTLSEMKELEKRDRLIFEWTGARVFCPARRHYWNWKLVVGEHGEIRFPNIKGICTCKKCEEEPVFHVPLATGTNMPGEPSPSQENAIRAMEDQ